MDFLQLLAHVGEQHGGTKLDLLRPVPLHPILVNFTAALLPVSLLSDVLGRLLKRESLRHAAWWTLLFAAAVTPLTALAVADPPPRRRRPAPRVPARRWRADGRAGATGAPRRAHELLAPWAKRWRGRWASERTPAGR